LPINGAVVSAIQPVASFWPTERKRGLIMKTSQGFKVLTAVGLFVSLSASLSVATIAFAGKASAATPLSAVTCSHLKGSIITDTATLSGCSGTTGGSGSVSSFVPTGGDVTWSNGTTTDYTSTYANSGTKCPSTAFEVNIKGTVSSSTNTSIPVGAVVKMKVCDYASSGKSKSATGTVVKF
jgi:hypothetical protein